MKKTSSFAVARFAGVFALAALTCGVAFGLAGKLEPVQANPVTAVLISNVQVNPDPYDPLSQSLLTFSFEAHNVKGEHFSAVVLDSTQEMLTAWTGRELQEGLNTWTWNPPYNLENGKYLFTVSAPTDYPSQMQQYSYEFQVLQPDWQPLVITDLKFAPAIYQLSAHIPLTISFEAQHAQNRHFAAAILDPYGGTLEEWNMAPLQEGTNSLQWWGYQNPLLKAGKYTFVLKTPLASNSQFYSQEFEIVE